MGSIAWKPSADEVREILETKEKRWHPSLLFVEDVEDKRTAKGANTAQNIVGLSIITCPLLITWDYVELLWQRTMAPAALSRAVNVCTGEWGR